VHATFRPHVVFFLTFILNSSSKLRTTVLPLYAHSRLGALGVVSQRAEIQQRAASLAAEVERRGRAPPPRIRFEHASSILWCWWSGGLGGHDCQAQFASAE
jgi:hypothetical protein